MVRYVEELSPVQDHAGQWLPVVASADAEYLPLMLSD
jgi:hypothetical protein